MSHIVNIETSVLWGQGSYRQWSRWIKGVAKLAKKRRISNLDGSNDEQGLKRGEGEDGMRKRRGRRRIRRRVKEK